MRRFPLRTLVLMVLALLAFIWMWWNTHGAVRPPRAEPKGAAVPVEVVPLPSPSDAGVR
jgi:hypothetical protein